MRFVKVRDSLFNEYYFNATEIACVKEITGEYKDSLDIKSIIIFKSDLPPIQTIDDIESIMYQILGN